MPTNVTAISARNRMIYLHGDSHGDFTKFIHHVRQLQADDILIHVGDFGFYPNAIAKLHNAFPDGLPCVVYVIDGNHEDFSYLYSFPVNNGLREILKNLYHVPRGSVMTLEGKTFAFLGGGESIDYVFRKKNVSWWEEERITNTDIITLVENCKGLEIDYFITHVCTSSFRDTFFPTLMLQNWNLPEGWRDISMEQVTRVISIINPKVHIFGHMHRSINTGNQILLDIDEIRPLYWEE